MIVGSYVFFQTSWCRPALIGRSSQGGSPIIKPDRINQGYTLITPLNTQNNLNQKGYVYLIDLYGRAVHQWETQLPPFHARLKPDGNLVVALITPAENKNSPGGGRTGLIQELAWNGGVVWEYKNDKLHHDFDVLPNGNIAALTWETVPQEIADNIRGGLKGTDYQGAVWADAINEIDRSGNIIYSWRTSEHLDPTQNSLGPLTTRAEWTHSNSIQHLEKNPLTGSEAYLLSLRHLNKVVMIDRASARIIWESPKNLVSYQHDATLLDNGNILIFDNNHFQKQNAKLVYGSRVVEVNPNTNQVVWEFMNGKSALEKASFSASIVSGAQRLPNGNTLITNGVDGHIFEVTPQNGLVWDMINPYPASRFGAFPSRALFKGRRYSASEASQLTNLPDPLPTISNICSKLNFY